MFSSGTDDGQNRRNIAECGRVRYIRFWDKGRLEEEQVHTTRGARGKGVDAVAREPDGGVVTFSRWKP